jgi:hypothetical protein
MLLEKARKLHEEQEKVNAKLLTCHNYIDALQQEIRTRDNSLYELGEELADKECPYKAGMCIKDKEGKKYKLEYIEIEWNYAPKYAPLSYQFHLRFTGHGLMSLAALEASLATNEYFTVTDARKETLPKTAKIIDIEKSNKIDTSSQRIIVSLLNGRFVIGNIWEGYYDNLVKGFNAKISNAHLVRSSYGSYTIRIPISKYEKKNWRTNKGEVRYQYSSTSFRVENFYASKDEFLERNL